MKKLFTLSAVMLVSILMFGQHRGGHKNDNRESEKGSYNQSTYYNTSYSRDGDYRNRQGRNNSANSSRFQRLSFKDQKRMRKLWHKLEKQERMSWRDGFLSRRERRYILDINNDINRIWSKYERRSNSCGSRNYWG